MKLTQPHKSQHPAHPQILQILIGFRRITSSTKYLPEIDGLRFLAIFSVVVVMHLTNFINQKLTGSQLLPDGYIKKLILNGGMGVSLFFMISAFILSLPFAKWKLQGGARPSLPHYYLRRLVRLEPPYLIALLLFFFAHLFVFRYYSLQELMPHFFASAVYLHGFIYHYFSIILPVAWSLEVEVQFYVLAPLFFLVFMIRSQWLRRGLLVAIILASAAYWFDSIGFPHVFKYLQYFFSGILLADLYTSDRKFDPGANTGAALGAVCLLAYFFVLPLPPLCDYMIKIVAMTGLFYLALNNTIIKRVFSQPIMATIGGMCYSIYLLHFGILSALNFLLERVGIVQVRAVWTPVLAVVFLAVILLISGTFYYFIERPFMKVSRQTAKRSNRS